MNLAETVMEYCERTGPGLFAEPLNACSNAAFLYAAWRLWQRAAGAPTAMAAPQRLLAALIALVGVASLCFHTFATRWAGILDVACIGIFNLTYLFVFLRRLAAWQSAAALAATVMFVVADRSAGLILPEEALNGSVLYLPALTALLALTVYAWRLAPAAGRVMTGAGAVFLVSLTARTLDPLVCSVWPWGTHFLWHLLNAWVLYRLSRALVTAQAEPDAARAN